MLVADEAVEPYVPGGKDDPALNVSEAMVRVPVKFRATVAPLDISRGPVPRAAAFEQDSVPAVILLAPEKLLVPDSSRGLPPVLVKPPVPLILPLRVKDQAALAVAVAFRVIGPLQVEPHPLLL